MGVSTSGVSGASGISSIPAPTYNVINGSGNNNIVGTSGNDLIYGNSGAKLITGNGGANVFAYRAITDVGHTITDFVVGVDKIDLSALLLTLPTPPSPPGANAIATGHVRVISNPSISGATIQTDRDGSAGSAVFRNFIHVQNIDWNALNSPANFIF
jgi:Ca2+-binding RTX toxin-like protein